MTPWHMFLIRKGIISQDDFVSIRDDEEADQGSDEVVDEEFDEEKGNDATKLGRGLIKGVDVSNAHNMITLELDYETMEGSLLLHASSLILQSESIEEGLLPCMSMAVSSDYKLSDVYAMDARNIFLRNAI